MTAPTPTDTICDPAAGTCGYALARWFDRNGGEVDRARTDQSFCVPKADIVANSYDLSINRYKEIVHEEVEHRPPAEITADLRKLEDEITQGLADLEAML